MEMVFSVKGDQELNKALIQLEKMDKDIRPILFLMGEAMKRGIAETFRNQRSPSGVPWPPISNATSSIRPGGGGGAKRLSETRRLFRSVAHRPPVITKTSVTIEPDRNLPYAHIHQFGGIIKPKTAEYLTQPLTRQARLAGSVKAWWQRMESQKKNPFVLMRRTPAGHDGVIAITKSSKRSKRSRKDVEAHWLLRKQVTILPSPYLGFSDKMKQDIVDIAKDQVRRAWSKRKR
jgi:phage gpG-like protein